MENIGTIKKEKEVVIMNFIWISPQFPASYWNFCDRMKTKGVRVLGIGDTPYLELSQELKQSLSEYYYVRSLENYDDVYRAFAYFTFHYGRIDYVESNNEYWLEQDARLRTDYNVCGLKTNMMHGMKSKSAMKEFFNQANVGYARFQIVSTIDEARKFVKEVGYPLIVKPDIGVGAAATYKIKDEIQLLEFYEHLPNIPYIMEEYVEGVIISYDGIANSNREVLYDTSHVFPTPIMDIVNEHDHLYYYTNRMIDKDIREAGKRVVKAFPTNQRFFHIEFFRLTKSKTGLGKKGDIVALEINMRPPGGYTPDMMNFAGSIDIYKIYADVMINDTSDADIEHRPYYCVYASRRDQKHYVHSLEEVCETYQERIVMRERMPDVLSGAMGNEMFTACFKTKDEVDQFVSFVHETI